MFTPTWPEDSALNCLEAQLGVLAVGCVTDDVSKYVACLPGTRDEARAALAHIWWEKCGLSDASPRIQRNERLQLSNHGSYTLRDPFWVSPVKGLSLGGKFMRFWSRHVCDLNARSAQYADAQLRRWIIGGSLRATTALEAALSFEHKSARGWPWFVSTPRAPLCYLNEAESILAAGLNLQHARAYPGVGGTRGAAKGPGQTASWRAVFGMSLVPNILKKMLHIPVRHALIGTTKFCAWRNRAAVDRAVSAMLKSNPHGKPILSVDFSNFDASIPEEVLVRMFHCLSIWFRAADRPLVRWCQEAFLRTGLYIPGRGGTAMYLSGSDKRGGVPSGSVLTNLIDSMVNFWAVTYAAHRLGVTVEECLLQGDDGVYRFVEDMNFDDLSDVLSVELGMTMSPSKCLISDQEVMFLQSTHGIDLQVDGICIGSRPIMRFLNGFMKPFPQEGDAKWGDLLSSVRTLQQFDNCSGHPCFEQGWRWLWHLDYESMHEAILRLCNNDPSILERVGRVRSFRAGGVSTTVDDLYKSSVVNALLQAFPRCFSLE